MEQAQPSTTPTPNITSDVWIGLGLGVIGIVLAAAGVAISLAAVTISTIAIAIGFGLVVLGVAAAMFGIIETRMNLPMSQPDPFTLENGDAVQVPYAPPDGGGTDGDGDGGGGGGTDQRYTD